MKKIKELFRKNKKHTPRIIWAFIIGVSVILSIIVNLNEINNFFLKTPKVTEEATKQTEVKEYIFGNQFFYIQALVNESNSVLAYGVTIRDEDFNPTFKILENAFTADKDNPEDFSKATPLAYNIVLGKTHFSDIPSSPENIFSYLGARRLYYHEEYYFGNPGNYQSYFMGVNDSGNINIDYNNLEFFGEKNINYEDKAVSQFRKNSIINTFAKTSPFTGFNNDKFRKYLVGPDLDQVRVISEMAIKTKESKDSLLEKINKLSTEMNIQFYIENFGQPIIVNNTPYMEIRDDLSLNKQWDLRGGR